MVEFTFRRFVCGDWSILVFDEPFNGMSKDELTLHVECQLQGWEMVMAITI